MEVRDDEPWAVSAVNLTKTFYARQSGAGIKGALKSLILNERRLVTAVDKVSFSIVKGEIVGFLGPNGAGKSTTLKMLTGILHPTKGEVHINGICPHRHRIPAVKKIGVTFGHRSQLFWDLRLEESFELLKRVYEVPPDLYSRNLKWLSETMSFRDYLNIPVRQLSLGQRMRAEIAAALLHSPDILFLDEPTLGLDIDAKDAVRQIIRKVNAEYGTTVILTTHDIGDIKAVCRRLIIIDKGQIVEDGSIDYLLETFAADSILMIEFDHKVPELLHPQISIDRQEEKRLWLRFDAKKIAAGKLISDLCSKHVVQNISLKEPDIEDVIRRYYAR